MTLEDEKYVGTAEAEAQTSEGAGRDNGIYWRNYECKPQKAIINRKAVELTSKQVQDYMNRFEMLLKKGWWIEAGLECIEEGLDVGLLLYVNSTLMAEAMAKGDEKEKIRFRKYDRKIRHKTNFKEFGDEYSIERQERSNNFKNSNSI